VHSDRLVRPWLEGPTLAELALPLTDLTPFVHLLRVLEKAHARGLLHLNLKPQNLVLTAAGLQPVDFGLARFSRVRGRLAEVPAEDVLYLAPEVTGLVRAEVGPEADLYAVGALLFEALTGAPPFSGSTASEVLRASLVEAISCPNPVIERLLARSPRDRYNSARQAWQDLEALLAGRPPVARPSSGLAAPAFVGRERELSLLRDRPVAIVVGEAGMGKTRLLQEVGYTHYSSARPGPRPLQLFAGLIDELLRSADWPRLRDELGAYCGLLAWAFPELQPVLGPPSEATTVAPGQLAAALVRLVHSLEGACIALDDLQWADEVSLEALRKLAADPSPFVRVVAACRPFADLPVPATLRLEALDGLASQALLESMAGTLDDARASDLCELAGGTPLLLVEGLRGSWQRTQVRVGEGGAELLARRLDAFRAPVLESVAVLGEHASAPAVAFVLEEDPSEGLEEARRAGLLWREAGGVYHFAHDRLRETVLERLETPTRLHERAAVFHEEVGEPGPAALHWLAAGERERAAPLALQAARDCRARLDHATALEFYALCEAPDAEVAECLRLAGRRREAVERAERGLARATTPLEQARLLYIQGQAVQDMDDVLRARGLLTAALERLQVLGPKLPLWKLLFPLRTGTPRQQASEEVALTLQIANLLAHVLTDSGEHIQSLSLVRQVAHIVCKHPDAPQAGLVVATISCFQLMVGARGAALETARHARALLHSSDLYTRGRGRARASMIEWARPALSCTLRITSQFVDELQRASCDPWETSVARFVYGLHLTACGRLAEAQALGRELVRGAREAEDRLFLSLGLSLWAQASYGDIPLELVEAELHQPSTSAFQKTQLHLAGALAALRQNDPQRARELLAFPGGARDPGPQDTAMRNLGRAVASRLCGELTGDESYFREARHFVRKVLSPFTSWFLITRLPALREAGLLAAARGHTARARKLLDEAVSLATRADAWYEAAQSRLAWGRIGLVLGWEGAEEALERARHELRQMGATWLVDSPAVDPVQHVLDWGRTLAVEPSRVEEACRELPEVSRFFESVAEAATLNASREERQALARLEVQRQEEELRALFGAAGVGLVVVADGVVVEENETFRSWAGGSWVGRPIPGVGEHELPSGLLSRWTSADGRLYTVTLVVQLEQLEEAQAASRASREARMERLRARLAGLGVELGRLGLVGGEKLDLPVVLDRPLPSLTARTLQRLLQEALANARRHAAGFEVRVSVRCEGDWVVGSVEDDGPGFDPSLVSSRMGVRGMQWRARFCGGECTVESAPGKGAAVRFRLPLR